MKAQISHFPFNLADIGQGSPTRRTGKLLPSQAELGLQVLPGGEDFADLVESLRAKESSPILEKGEKNSAVENFLKRINQLLEESEIEYGSLAPGYPVGTTEESLAIVVIPQLSTSEENNSDDTSVSGKQPVLLFGRPELFDDTEASIPVHVLIESGKPGGGIAVELVETEISNPEQLLTTKAAPKTILAEATFTPEQTQSGGSASGWIDLPGKGLESGYQWYGGPGGIQTPMGPDDYILWSQNGPGEAQKSQYQWVTGAPNIQIAADPDAYILWSGNGAPKPLPTDANPAIPRIKITVGQEVKSFVEPALADIATATLPSSVDSAPPKVRILFGAAADEIQSLIQKFASVRVEGSENKTLDSAASKGPLQTEKSDVTILKIVRPSQPAVPAKGGLSTQVVQPTPPQYPPATPPAPPLAPQPPHPVHHRVARAAEQLLTDKATSVAAGEVAALNEAGGSTGSSETASTESPAKPAGTVSTKPVVSIPVRLESANHQKSDNGSVRLESTLPPTSRETAPVTRTEPLARIAESTRPGSTEVVEQVTRSIRVQSNSKTSEIRVRLVPETLGEIHVRISSKDGVITAELRANVAATRAVLSEQTQQIQALLQESGIAFDKVVVKTGSLGSPPLGGGEQSTEKGQEEARSNDKFTGERHQRGRGGNEEGNPHRENRSDRSPWWRWERFA